ncbi:MAG TPA: IS66 family transposase, partial [Roseibacterium sp.]|nr:IS66 family transposase [Roseibacterium sp.]
MTKPSKRKGRRAPAARDLKIEELESILEQTKAGPLGEEDHKKLSSAVGTLALLTQEIENKGTTIKRLRDMLFGLTSEKTEKVMAAAAVNQTPSAPPEKKPRKKVKGHGRNPAEAYRGAEQVCVCHEELRAKGPCPKCRKGKLYQQKPAQLVRVTGMAPLGATVISLDRLRCKMCGEVFTASAPPGVGTQKYDETAASMIALLKYGCGLPFYRLEQLQGNLRIPLPAATQWDVVSKAAKLLELPHQELVRQAAQGEVLYNDDTTMKILDLPFREPEKGEKPRTGIFTSCIISTLDKRRMALFVTGRQHAGENLADMIAQRSEDLAHGRRKFTDVAVNFPKDCLFVLEKLGEVYGHDAAAKNLALSPADRLLLHQENSKPLMDELEAWMDEQIEDKRVEPNSGLGQAINY